MSTLSDAQIYARQLLLKRHGYPLWVPEPYGNSVTYRTKGVRIGDVGYVTHEGAFESLFNVRAPPGDPINGRGVPEGFEQVIIPSEDIVHIPNFHQPDSTVTTAAMKRRTFDLEVSTPDILPVSPGIGTNIQFTWSTSQGAILHLPDGASRLTCPADLFRDAAIRGAKNWYKFVNVTLRRNVPNGALYLVTGCDKTDSWMVGAFSDKSSETQVSFHVSAGNCGGGRASYSYSWGTSTPAVFRTGPTPSIDSPETLERHRSLIDQDDSVFLVDAPQAKNQCIFLRGYRIMLRTGPIPLVLGGSSKVEVDSISFTNPKDISRPPCHRSSSHLPSSEPIASLNHQKYIAESWFKDPPHDSVLLGYLPGVLDTYHPATAINKSLLDFAPQADVSLVHDDEWCAVITEDDSDIPNDTVLTSRIFSKFSSISYTGATILVPRNSSFHESHSGVRRTCGRGHSISLGKDIRRSFDHYQATNGSSETPFDPHTIAPGSSPRDIPSRKAGLAEITNTREASNRGLPPRRLKRKDGRPFTTPNPPTFVKGEAMKIIRRQKSFDTR